MFRFLLECLVSFWECLAQSGLGPSPGWGPVRVGAEKRLGKLHKKKIVAWFGFKICFLKKFLDRSVSFLCQETHEHVKTLKKRCLEAQNDIFSWECI